MPRTPRNRPAVTRPTILRPNDPPAPVDPVAPVDPNSDEPAAPAPAAPAAVLPALVERQIGSEDDRNLDRIAQQFSPDVSGSAEGGDHGKAYVRMFNSTGVIVPVVATHVPDRLCDGYRFIQGEPGVPRYLGDPEKPDAPGPYVPDFCKQPMTNLDGLIVWATKMANDRRQHRGHKQLLWGFLSTVSQKIAAAQRAPDVGAAFGDLVG